jgi:hypothetical protein
MLKRVRRKLAEIRYYSAARDESAWAKAAEWVLPLAVVLAVVIVLVLETLVVEIVPLESYHGSLAMPDDGTLVAALARRDKMIPPLPGRPFGDFTVSVVDERRGLLITTAINDRRVSLDLNLFDEVGTRIDARLAPDSAERAAIADAVMRRGLDLTLPGPAATPASDFGRVWTGTLLGAALWAFAIAVVLMIALRLARLGWLVQGAKKADRAADMLAQGRCHACGYDLQGLEFNERCPECGALVR